MRCVPGPKISLSSPGNYYHYFRIYHQFCGAPNAIFRFYEQFKDQSFESSSTAVSIGESALMKNNRGLFQEPHTYLDTLVLSLLISLLDLHQIALHSCVYLSRFP